MWSGRSVSVILRDGLSTTDGMKTRVTQKKRRALLTPVTAAAAAACVLFVVGGPTTSMWVADGVACSLLRRDYCAEAVGVIDQSITFFRGNVTTDLRMCRCLCRRLPTVLISNISTVILQYYSRRNAVPESDYMTVYVYES